MRIITPLPNNRFAVTNTSKKEVTPEIEEFIHERLSRYFESLEEK